MKKILSIYVVSILFFSMIGIGDIQIKDQSDGFSISIRDGNVSILESIPENQVYIYRDVYGVPHIYGDSNRAMFFGEGYAQAEDHLEEMLLNYRTAQGAMAEVFGSEYIDSDKEMRLLCVASSAREKYQFLSMDTREAVEAFAQGVNYYMENNPEKVPEWATPVTPQEIIAWSNACVISRPLSRLKDDIERGLGISISLGHEDIVYESNEWVVAPEKTADGYVMVQSDPHLPWFGMNAKYEVHLKGPDYNVAGSTTCGVPGVSGGHNDHIAWAGTANNPDTADAYIETINPINPHQYRYDGQWQDMEVVRETIQVAGSNPEEVELLYTHHGPIVYQKDGLTIAGKLSTWGEISIIEQGLKKNRATNINEFKAAISMSQAPRGNIAYGDVDGNIFYIWNGRVFHRQGNYDYTIPVDGSTSKTEWGDIVTIDELPQELNPESKFFQNCNTAPWFVNPKTTINKDDYPDYIVGGGFGARGIRATNLLDADWDLTVEEMKAISFDTYSLYAEILIPLLQHGYEHEGENVSDPKDLLPQAINILSGWDYCAEADSEEIALGRLWINEAKQLGIDLLNPPQPGDLTTEEIQDGLQLLINAADTMLETYGSLTIPWGDIHILKKGDHIFPLSGAGHVLSPLYMAHGDVADDGIMYCDRGSSYLMLTQLSNPIKSWSVFPVSESNDPESPHYTDISELYSRKEYKPAWFTEEEILENLDPVDPNPRILQLPDENYPPYAPDINGQSDGKAGKEYTFDFFTIDPNVDDVFYYVDWGDGEKEEWIGPYSSGEEITLSHTWNEKGSYIVRAKAKDTNDAESNWGTLYVSMPKSQQSRCDILQKLIEKLINRFLFLNYLSPIKSGSIIKNEPTVESLPDYDSPEDFFDMDIEKNMTLEELGWQKISEETLENGVVLTVGTWTAGQFDTFNSNEEPQTIQLDEKAAIYWPPNYPNMPNSQAGFGHVFAAHVDSLIYGGNPEILAEIFEIPILQHGENPNDWKELGFGGRNEMTEATFLNLMKVNPCEPVDLTLGNFGWALAKTNIRAITLLQRLAEERTGSVTSIALRGGSKEGFATWLASAVDDRIEVDGSGGYHLEDLDAGLLAYGTDWGCEGSGAGGASVIDLLLTHDWLVNSPAGQTALRAFSIPLCQDSLKPRFFIIAGDVTRFDMHDGHYYALGCETPFLDGFNTHPWRYDRLPNFTREDTSIRQTRIRALLLEQLVNGPEYHQEVYPKVTSTSVDENGRSFMVTAQVSPEPETVRLWWSHSDDRVWNDQDNPPFEESEMTKEGAMWISEWVDVPGTDEVAWYVEAENTFSVDLWELPRRDASPVRFLWRLPEVGCDVDAPDWCEPSPDTPTINGPSSGKAGIRYEYIFKSTDPDGDDIFYYIDWGDGDIEEWIGSYSSGEQITIGHTWNDKGSYTIRAKAKDTNGDESDWQILEVSMPKNKQIFLQIIEWLLERFPLLRQIPVNYMI